MTRVVSVAQTLNDHAFEALLAEAADAGDEKLLFDARHVRFADPYGMTGLLALGPTSARRAAAPCCSSPQSSDVQRYFAGIGSRPPRRPCSRWATRRAAGRRGRGACSSPSP